MDFVPTAKRMTLKQKGPVEDNMSSGSQFFTAAE